MNNGNRRSGGNWQRRVLQVLCIVLAVILVFLLAVTIFIEHKYSLLNKPGSSDETKSSEQIDSIIHGETDAKPSETLPTVTIEVDESKNPAATIEHEAETLNIVLVGEDHRPWEDVSRSDATILCSLNLETGEMQMISFQRDMYVQIPDYFHHKFNTAYALDGFDCLNSTLAYNFGVRVDGDIAVDFDKFMDIVDAVGGVDIDLTSDEVNYMLTFDFGHTDMEYTWDLSTGVNHLDGAQALAYARIRGIDSDFARNERQRAVILAIVEQCRNMSIMELNGLLNKVLPMITTNIPLNDIIEYSVKVFPLLKDIQIHTQQIPAEDTYYLGWTDQDGGMSIVVYDEEANRKILEDLLS